MKEIDEFYRSLRKEDLILAYSLLLENLKREKIIRTNNLVGDLGETLAIEHFNSEEDLPNLIQAETNTEAYDAHTKDKTKYAIKSTSTQRTGIFYGLEPEGSEKGDKQIFDYVIIVKFNKNYSVEHIYQLNWDTFLKIKQWHETAKAWIISLTKKYVKQMNTLK